MLEGQVDRPWLIIERSRCHSVNRSIDRPDLTETGKGLVRIVNETFGLAEKLMLKTSTVTPEAIATGFHALSDPLRIQVLELLRQQELCVCELCENLSVSQSKLSFHLKTLKEVGLIRGRQEGRWIYYSLNLPQLVELEQYLADYRRFSPMLPGPQCDDI